MKEKNHDQRKNTCSTHEQAFILKRQRGWSTTRIARHFGVSTRTIQRWLRLRTRGEPSSQDQAHNIRVRKPRYGEAIRGKITALRKELPSRSATTIHRLLLTSLGKKCPPVVTIRRILREEGLAREKKPRNKDYVSFEREFPNDMWQIDFKGWDLVGHLGKLHLLAVMDDCSRFIPAARWYTTDRAENVLHLLKDAFEAHGLPNQVLSDNGSQFKNVKGEVNTTKYYRLLRLLGVQPIFHKARHPESKGKLERWFGFVDSSFMPDARLHVERHPGITLVGFNKLFGRWVEWYNNQHEHTSLDRMVPGGVFRDHPKRRYEPLQATFDWESWTCRIETRKVDKLGRVSIDGRFYTLPDGFSRRRIEVHRFPGRIEASVQGRHVETFIIPSEEADALDKTKVRKVNKDGYFKFNKRYYKLGTKHAMKTVRVHVSLDEKEILIYEDDRLVSKIDVNEGSPY